jgi:hypothetical protein
MTNYVIRRDSDDMYHSRKITHTPNGATIGPETWTADVTEASGFICPVSVPAGYSCIASTVNPNPDPLGRGDTTERNPKVSHGAIRKPVGTEGSAPSSAPHATRSARRMCRER